MQQKLPDGTWCRAARQCRTAWKSLAKPGCVRMKGQCPFGRAAAYALRQRNAEQQLSVLFCAVAATGTFHGAVCISLTPQPDGF